MIVIAPESIARVNAGLSNSQTYCESEPMTHDFFSVGNLQFIIHRNLDTFGQNRGKNRE